MNANVTAVPGHSHSEAEAVHAQRELGFWLYLMGDAVIFALLFMTYGIMVGNTAGGPTGKQLFSLNNAALETALLLISSTTFGFASLSSRQPTSSGIRSCDSSQGARSPLACVAWRALPMRASAAAFHSECSGMYRCHAASFAAE